MGSVVRRKFVPVMVRGNAAFPAGALLGAIVATVGTGLGGGNTMKAMALERPLVPVPECGCTVCTKLVPAFAIIDAGTTALTETILPVSFAGAHVFAAVVVTTHVLSFV